MIDALWIAASGVSYALTDDYLRLHNPSSVELGWAIDAHPCDDQPYVADIRIVTAQHDGRGDG